MVLIPSCDVLIVGGGLSACACAVRARLAGASVVVVARGTAHRFPSQILPAAAEPLLRELGVVDAVDAATEARHEGTWTNWSGEWTFRPHGWHDDGTPLRDIQIDGSLARIVRRRAESLGAVFVDEPAVRVETYGGRVEKVVLRSGLPLTGGWIVDATGASRWLARQLGVSTDVDRSALYWWLEPRADFDPPRIVGADEAWVWAAPLGRRGTLFVATFPRPGARARAHLVHAQNLLGANYAAVGDAACISPLLTGRGILRALSAQPFPGGERRRAQPPPLSPAEASDQMRRVTSPS